MFYFIISYESRNLPSDTFQQTIEWPQLYTVIMHNNSPFFFSNITTITQFSLELYEEYSV